MSNQPSSIPLTNVDVVLQPITEARGLPNAHYVSEEVYQEEKHVKFYLRIGPV